MDNKARGAEEEKVTAAIQREITTGEVARDFKFFEQMQRDHSGTRSSSEIQSSATRKRNTSNNQNNRRNSLLNISQDDSTEQRRNSSQIGEEPYDDPWFELLDELKDRVNKMKGRLSILKKTATVEERTFEERETLMQRWLEIADVEHQINELLADYQKGPTVHPRITLQTRCRRAEQFQNFCELLLDEVHKDFVFVSQLKF